MEFLGDSKPEYPVYFNYDQDPANNATLICNVVVMKDMRTLDDDSCVTGIYLTD